MTNSYDAGWRQTSACSSLGGCYASSATYNALDEPATWTYGNGLGQSFTYDVLGRATSIQVGGGTVLSLDYGYDNVGNVATNTDTLNGQTQNYAYDHRDRLTHAWTTGSTTAAYDESYTYNAIGNITGKGPTGSLATYGYNASGASSVRPHAVTSVGGDVYAYDGNGNMTSRTGKAITWNVDNTVASVVGPDNVPEGYTYDANGGRATRSRNLGQSGGFTTAYIGGLYEEDTPSGDKRVLYVFAGRVICQRTIVGSTPTVVYLHGDMLGSTGATTSSAGATTATQRYTPFGSVRAGGSLPTTIDFTGQRRDGTGLLFYNARYYDPTIGRFASADSIVPGAASGKGGAAASLGPDDKAALRPLTVDFHEPGFSGGLAAENRFTLEKGFHFQLSDEDRRQAKGGAGPANPQALNRYAYVLNNPVRYTDPSGHFRHESHWWGDEYTLEPSDIDTLGLLIVYAGAAEITLGLVAAAVAIVLGLTMNPLCWAIAAFLFFDIFPGFVAAGFTAADVGGILMALAAGGMHIEVRCAGPVPFCWGWFWFSNFPTFGFGEGSDILRSLPPEESGKVARLGLPTDRPRTDRPIWPSEWTSLK